MGVVAAVGLSAVAGGTYYARQQAEQRRAERSAASRKKWGLAATAGLAATGAAAYGGYKAWEARQGQPDASDGSYDEDGEIQPSEKDTSKARPARVAPAKGKTPRKKQKSAPKSSGLLGFSFLTLLGLALLVALVGGAVYYFVFCSEDGESVDDGPNEAEELA